MVSESGAYDNGGWYAASARIAGWRWEWSYSDTSLFTTSHRAARMSHAMCYRYVVINRDPGVCGGSLGSPVTPLRVEPRPNTAAESCITGGYFLRSVLSWEPQRVVRTSARVFSGFHSFQISHLSSVIATVATYTQHYIQGDTVLNVMRSVNIF